MISQLTSYPFSYMKSYHDFMITYDIIGDFNWLMTS